MIFISRDIYARQQNETLVLESKRLQLQLADTKKTLQRELRNTGSNGMVHASSGL